MADDFFVPDVKKVLPPAHGDDFFTPDQKMDVAGVGNSPNPPTTTPNSLRKLLGIGIRVGSGFLPSAASGGVPGAVTGAVGEGLAEAAEGSLAPHGDLIQPRLNESPLHAAGRSFLSDIKAPISRMGVEAGFGAIPFNKTVKSGEVLNSALRSGVLGAAKTEASKLTEGATQGKFTPASGTDVGLGAGLGALFGGAAAGWAGLKDKFHTLMEPSAPSTSSSLGDAGLPPKDQTRQIQRDQKNLVSTQAWLDKTRASKQAAIEAAPKESDAADAIAQAREGLVPKAPVTSDSYSASNGEGGKSRVTIPYGKPEEPKAPRTQSSNPLSDLMDLFMQKEAEKSGKGFNWDEAGGRMEPDATGSHRVVPPTAEGLPDIAPSAVVGDTGNIHPITETPVAPAQAPATVEPVPQQESPQTPPQQVAISPSHQYAIDHYPDEVNAELDKLGSAYRAGDKSAGKGMAELRDFMNPKAKMRESWKGAPAAEGNVPAPTPVEGSIKDQVESRANEGIQPTNAPPPNTGEDRILPSQQRDMTPEEIQSEHNWIDRLRGQGSGPSHRNPTNEQGFASPGMQRLMRGVVGAAIGAPTGSTLYPDHPIKGALGGALLGGAVASGGLKSLVENRDAGLLLGPAMIKKHLSDLGTIGLTGTEDLISGQMRGDTAQKEKGLNAIKELFRLPTNAANYKEGFLHPEVAGDVVGSSPTAEGAPPPQTPFLRQVVRGYTAPQHMTSEIMRRAGYSPDEIGKALNMGDPSTKLGQDWVNLGRGNSYAKLLRPFARYATNLAEGGLQRVPGVSLIPKLDKALGGDPNTKWGRTILGGLTTGAGVMQGMQDQDSEDAGQPVDNHPFTQATLARHLPNYVMGEALSNSKAGRELRKIYIPALGTSVPDWNATGANADTPKSYAKKALDTLLEQMLPDAINPASKSGKAR